MPTGYLRLSNGGYLRRGLGPQGFALDTPGCKKGSSPCCYFRDFTPDAIGWTLSGCQDNGASCSCHDGTIYLPWHECLGQNCNWYQTFSCDDKYGDPVQFGCLGYLSGDDGDGLHLQLTCAGGVPSFLLSAGRDVSGGESNTHLYQAQLTRGDWPLCGGFSIAANRVAGAPSWLPSTCTIFGADGTPATDLEDCLEANYMQWWFLCDNCGEVPDQIEAVLSSFAGSCVTFNCSDLNDTYTLVLTTGSGCGNTGTWIGSATVGDCYGGSKTLDLVLSRNAFGTGWVLVVTDSGGYGFRFTASASDCTPSGLSMTYDQTLPTGSPPPTNQVCSPWFRRRWFSCGVRWSAVW